MNSIRVIQFGLGPIGCASAQAILEKKGLELVGAVDIAPDKAGKDLASVLGRKRNLGIRIHPDAAELFLNVKADVVVHTTGSFFKDVCPQLAVAATAGLSVVSSAEELLFPQLRNPELAGQLDRLARAHGSTILGTGVNPGFVMDTLALVLSGVCKSVRSIKIMRTVDASTRRMPLQRKVGAGMKPAEFRRLVKAGKLGHIGLLESMSLVAMGLGWKLDRTQERVQPVLAKVRVKSKYFTVARGDVCGLKHTGAGYVDGRKVIDMDLRMYLGASDPLDSIELQGEPKLRMLIPGGIAGDVATVASLINAIPRVLEAEPGLKTMLDLPIPLAFRAV
jgi:4-hydroxy-tetrahydrodipicolinate reductase